MSKKKDSAELGIEAVKQEPAPSEKAFSIVKDPVSNSYKIVRVSFNLGDPNVTEVDDQRVKAAAIESFKINVAKSGLLS